MNQKPVSLQEERDVMALADKAVFDSLEDGSFDFAGEVISSYRSLARVSELGLTRILHGVNEHWEKVEHEEGDDFFRWSIRNTGLSSLYIERQLGVWEMFSGNYIPKPYREPIRSHTVRQLVKIYSLVVAPKKSQVNYEFVDQDYDIEDKDWLALSEANDERRVSEIVAEIKGKPRNKNFMSLKIDRNGDIMVYQGKESATVGFLNVSEESPVVQKAIRRILDGAGITQRDDV